VAIQLISVGLSIMESLRTSARWLRNEPGLVSVIPQERPEEMLLHAGIDRDLAGASAAHALMVSLIGLVVLAVGVFSQIRWDDRPITAPLAHLSWRSGR